MLLVHKAHIIWMLRGALVRLCSGGLAVVSSAIEKPSKKNDSSVKYISEVLQCLYGSAKMYGCVYVIACVCRRMSCVCV